MGSVSSSTSYDVKKNNTASGSGSATATSRNRGDAPGDVSGTDDRVDKLTRLMTSHKKKRRYPGDAFGVDRDDEEFDGQQESMFILKQLYKRMDPAVMKSLGEAKGEVKLSLKYDRRRQMLLVKVVNARDLSAKDLRGKASDPYVRLDLVPDQQSEGAKTTSCKHMTLTPSYNEIFTFSSEPEAIPDTLLRVQIWSQDTMGKDDFMGERIIELGTLDFNEVITSWYQMQQETDLDIKGHLELSLTYRLPETLKITIHSASELVCRDSDKMPHPYVKVVLPGIPKVEQTKIIKGTLHPVWEEEYEYTIPQEELQNRYLVLHVLDKALVGDTEAMGQVYIDLSNLDIHHGYSGSFPLADLKNSDRVRTKWSQTTTVQEFREAMYAHAVYKYPKLIFQKHKGNKVLTVHSRKAGSSAKIRIVNGMPT
ncbi:synaptotagmin-1-like [Amphiura filiformis]|uniref:synaptotagmin-1-like n=1 Tax=Amphiura filiformis TaxID=82378 RepID=UPI003B21E3FD